MATLTSPEEEEEGGILQFHATDSLTVFD